MKVNTECESDHEQVEKISFPLPIFTVHLKLCSHSFKSLRMLLLLFSLMSFVVLVLFMKIVSPLSHFFVEFTGNVNIDLTGAIQMFTNTGTSV